MAVDNYTEMVHLFADTEAKLATVRQALEEGKHVLVLEKLAQRLAIPLDDTLLQEQWSNVRRHCSEAARRGDLAACLIIQDLMVESLAIALYRVFAGQENAESEAARVSNLLLEDELRHLDIGVARIDALIDQDADAVHDSLRWAHHRVMPELFDMVHQACDFLCHRHSLDCDVVEMGKTTIDLEMLKIAALTQYVDMLHTVRFDPEVTAPLLAAMSAYEPLTRRGVGLGPNQVLTRSGKLKTLGGEP
jgi:fatty aldehyde decarbonylase